MTFHYNLTGEARKQLVHAMAAILECSPRYLGIPTYAYEVGNYTVGRNGEVSCDDSADKDAVEMLVEALLEKGFSPESVDRPATEENEEQSPAAEEAKEGYGLTIIVPNEGFTETSLENLRKLVASKETLIRKALGCEERLEIKVEANRILFPWFGKPENLGENMAYAHFVTALCDMAKAQKRVTAKEKVNENEKYAFRCFLLRLGFIGSEFKAERKILMRNLDGSAAFRSGAKKSGFDAAELERRKNDPVIRAEIRTILNGEDELPDSLAEADESGAMKE